MLFTKKLVQKVHYETLQGGVGLTTTAVRENYWVPDVKGSKQLHWLPRLQALYPMTEL